MANLASGFNPGLQGKPDGGKDLKLSQVISLAGVAVGGIATARVLFKRHDWERRHNKVAICVDYDDVQDAAIRAGISATDLAHRLYHNGATHISLPELTLSRLLEEGQLAPQVPVTTVQTSPPVGSWNYLHGDRELITHLATELRVRLPYTQADVLGDETLVFAGKLSAIGDIGLGFNEEEGKRFIAEGLQVVPRPVAYDWPQANLIDRTLHQAGHLGRLVAFAGGMVLGHEMQLNDTTNALQNYGLGYVYFAETRHQRGDWYVAKKNLPNVVLGHRFTRHELTFLDFHAAAHNWSHLAKERGIRFCYVNFFRELHATEPLECLSYVHHLKHALEDDGFEVTAEVAIPEPVPTPSTTDLSLAGLGTAGITAQAATNLLNLPESVALPMTIVGAVGAAALPHLEARGVGLNVGHHHHHHDHDHGHSHDHHHHHDEQSDDHEHDHSHDHEHDHHHHHHHDHDHGDEIGVSYTPKLLALMSAISAPIATLPQAENGRWAEGILYQATAASTMAAVTSGTEYHLRIEDYKAGNLDWLVPLLGTAIWQGKNGIGWRGSAGIIIALLTAWISQRKNPDLLAQFDPGHAEGHTHHVSAAQVLIGDTMMAIGPNPARKWAGLAPIAFALAVISKGHKVLAGLFAFIGTIGSILGLLSFRRSDRALDITVPEAGRSFLAGSMISLLLYLFGKRQ